MHVHRVRATVSYSSLFGSLKKKKGFIPTNFTAIGEIGGAGFACRVAATLGSQHSSPPHPTLSHSLHHHHSKHLFSKRGRKEKVSGKDPLLPLLFQSTEGESVRTVTAGLQEHCICLCDEKRRCRMGGLFTRAWLVKRGEETQRKSSLLLTKLD